MSASTTACEAGAAPGAETLRRDLRLYPGPRVGGAPSAMLYDPVRGSYFQLVGDSLALLRAWDGPARAATLEARLLASGEAPQPGAAAAFLDFARRHELTENPDWQAHARRREARRSSPLAWIVHNYLFIRLPLWRPRRAFERALPLVAPLYTRPFLVATLVAAALALHLVSRQWAAFLGTFPSFLSLDGALVYALALTGCKAVHELAHAFTAARYGCRVASIGLALMVMAPMPYCDVTDSWRLVDRRQRMAIDAAGMLAELTLAVYAALLWVLLPDGAWRSAAFLVATASLVGSLAVNLNPLMRFDGYLLLADALAVPNLQARAFALGRWRLREALFGMGAPKPDVFPAGKQRIVLAYAAAVVAYRAVVYAGIALLVYHAAFKLLGIALFAIEVGWFLVRPVTKEAAVWWQSRGDILASPRSRVTAALAALALVAAVFPFRARVAIPAVVEPAAYARLYPLTPGVIVSVAARRGARVEAGQALVTLRSPQHERASRLARLRLALVEARLARLASVAEDRAERLALDGERGLLIDKLAGLERERRDLVLRAPIAGLLRDLDPDLEPGRWLGRDAPVALVVSPEAAVARGLRRDGTAEALKTGDHGTFYPDSFFMGSAEATVTDVAEAAAARLDIPALSSLAGGPVAARPAPEPGSHARDAMPGAAPEDAVFPVRFALRSAAPRRVTRGAVLVDGERESLAGASLRQLARVLRRESGF